MPRALALMRAIIGPEESAHTAQRLLEEAMLVEVDPLLHAAFSLHLDVNTALERGAKHIGVAYFETIPVGSDLSVPLRTERLAEIHMVRVTTLDRDIAYTAPDFRGLMALKSLTEADPALTRRVCVVPAAAMRQYLAGVAAPDLIDSARQTLARNWPRAAASLELTFGVRMAFAASVVAIIAVLVLTPYLAPAWIMPLWALIILLPALMRLAALLSPRAAPVVEKRIENDALPVYSVLVPLRDEADMVDQLCREFLKLDYPAHLLDIIFVVEQRSPETVAAVQRHLPKGRFSLVEVPHALPLTKPKALDFALPFCRGEFVVVFDAEDRPEPQQLRQIVGHFRRAPHLHCIQARLVIANGARGWLPALFAGEYAGLFSVFLPALGGWGAVIPLGGTSNHFRLASLRAVGGWDAYNVTEDADLGVRLARRRLNCGTSSAVTYEDAPESLTIWMGQRRRWMKGWMQTFLVHNRQPRQLLKDLGLPRFLVFEIMVLGMILSPLLHTGFTLSCILALLLGRFEPFRLDLWSVSFLAVFAIGYGIAFSKQIAGLLRSGQKDILGWQLFLPIYWIAIAWATVRALIDLTMRPFHWIKTAHRPVSDMRPRQVPAE
ncbi:glycosyltransferase [Devosia sp. BK]|uniref:glycosyltransferase family 2 protein n=1 Tax=Devosia sp. BK TaxID=2871706 RepID=UPI00293A6850|nr:glycosyltransferase family 2 protein [Devosia sp. BK]MDV3253409.1 glycosyltransferase [Devosia sp. BK]